MAASVPRIRIHRADQPPEAVDDDPFVGMLLPIGGTDGDAVEVVPAGRTRAQADGFAEGYNDGHVAGHAAGHAAGFAAGHAQGLTTGRMDAVAEAREEVRAAWAPRLEEAARALVAAADGFADHHVQAVTELEGAVASLVFDLARAVVGHAITLGDVDPVRTLSRALQLAPAGPAAVRLHPDDAAQIAEEDLASLSGTRTVRLVPDPAVARGGAIVETHDQTVDLRLDAAFDRAAAALNIPTDR